MSAEPVEGAELADRWAFPYLLDWGLCGDEAIKRFRVLSTVARWFTEPAERAEQYGLVFRRWGDEWDPVGEQHLQNVFDLVAADVPIDVTLSAAKLGYFFMSLHGGNLVTGGSGTGNVAEPIVRLRPGFAWILARWFGVGFHEPCPWPFWLFARGGE